MNAEISFVITDEYINKAKEYLRKANFAATKSVFPYNEIKNREVSLTVRKNEICLYYNRLGQSAEKQVPFSHILRCVEVADGIMFELTKSRFLYIPLTDDGNHNEKVWRALIYIRKQIYRKHECLQSMECKKLSRAKRIQLVALQWYYGKNPHTVWARNALAVLCVCCVFIGTAMLVRTVWIYCPVEYKDTVLVQGEYKGYTTEYLSGRSVRTRIKIAVETNGKENEYISDYFIDRQSEVLEETEQGAQVQLCAHPRHHNILELVIDGRCILDFEETQDYITYVNRMWWVLVVCMYVSAVIMWQLCRKLNKGE